MVELSEYQNLVTSEHNQKPKFMDTVGLSVQPFVDAQNLLLGMPQRYDLDVSVGEQMDTDALWIGVNRFVNVPISDAYFSWDTVGLGWEQGVWQGEFDSSTGISKLDDDSFRLLLKARVIANQWNGTIADGNQALITLFSGSGTPNTAVYMYDFQDMSAALIISGQWPSAVFESILTSGELGLKPAGVTMHYLKVSANGQSAQGIDVAADLAGGWDTGVILVPVGSDPTPESDIDLNFMNPGTLDGMITFTRASTGTYFDSGGVLRTAATNVPRWDYDPLTHALRGLLLEDQRTNSATNFSTNWGIVASSITGSSVTSPDGVSLYWRWSEDASNSVHYIAQSPAGVPAGMATFSLFVKKDQIRYFQIYMDGSGGSGYATFDLQMGIISGPIDPTFGGLAQIQSMGGGVYRLSISVNVNSTDRRFGFLSCITPSPGFAPGFPGNPANGIFMWGAQLEVGNFPTSYILTSSGPVTRSQDRPVISAANMGWLSPGGGTWFAEFINIASTVGHRRVISEPRPGGGGKSPVFLDTSSYLGQYDGNLAMVSTNQAAVGTVHKAMSSFAAGLKQGKLCLDGGSISTASMTVGYSTFLSTGVVFMLEASPGSTENMSGYLRHIKYYPRLFSDAEMQAMTT